VDLLVQQVPDAGTLGDGRVWGLSLLLLGLGAVCALAVTPLTIWWARTGGGLDEPDFGRKKHDGAIPRLGGVPIFVALLAGLAVVFWRDPAVFRTWLPILCGGAIICGIGIWDDFKPLGARFKLAAQIGAAVVSYSLGLSITVLTEPGSLQSFALGGWGLFVTVLWLVAIPNIINFIDGMDGLAGGVGVVLFVTLGVVSLQADQVEVALIAFALVGGLLGFLAFNFPPARIFLGDGGAYLIGYAVASFSLQTSNKGSIAAVLFVMLIALGLPIIDAMFAVLRRAVRGFPVFRADREHVHHRLEDLGFSKTRIILSLYLVCVSLSLVGLSVLWSRGRTLPIAVSILCILAVVGARYLNYLPQWSSLRPRLLLSLRKRGEVRYAVLQGQLMELEVERCRSFDEFWIIFQQSLERSGFSTEKIDGARVIMLSLSRTEELELFVPAELGGRSAHWQRIAACFQPAYQKSHKKWGFRVSS
jgi:UDP-GlcNAc:undecaprenyl-phosphate GlcNAc-1-phosphate transferase